MARPLHLGQEVRGFLDGSGHELREEADEGRKGHGIAAGRELAAVDVGHVAQYLEGVETDADGQDEAERGEVGGEAEAAEQGREVFGEEAVVLEQAEHAEADRSRGHADGPCAPRPPGRTPQGEAAEIARRREARDEGKEAHVPPGVEHVARHHEPHVLHRQPPGAEAVEQEGAGEKQQKFVGVEKHGWRGRLEKWNNADCGGRGGAAALQKYNPLPN